MTFSRVCQESGKVQYNKAGIFLFWGVHAQEIPGGKPEIWLDLVRQISAAWPCHGWLSSRWLPAAARFLLFTGFLRQEYRSGLTFPSQGVFPTQGSNSSLLFGRWVLYHWASREQHPTPPPTPNALNYYVKLPSCGCLWLETTIYSKLVIMVWSQRFFKDMIIGFGVINFFLNYDSR